MAGCCGAGGFGHVQDSVQPNRIKERSIVGADKPHKQIDTLLGSEQLVTFDQEAARLLAAVGEPVILLCVHQKDYPLSSRRTRANPKPRLPFSKQAPAAS